MKLHYKGKYDLNPESLPKREHMPNAHQFKEISDTKKLGIIGNIVALAIAIILLAAAVPLLKDRFDIDGLFRCLLGAAAPMLILFPHELLHAVCFKGDVYIYTNMKQGMLFVHGTEDMSKFRFIFMSLLPNLVFGFIPYIIGLILPQGVFLIFFGAVSAGMGSLDYYNVFNALTQMPRGSRTYLYGMNSFWYIPQNSDR